MGGGVVGDHEGVVCLLERRRGRGQRELVIIEAPLDVEMGLHEILIALALGALDRLMVDLQPGQHRLKGPGGECPAAIRDQGFRGPIVVAACKQLAEPILTAKAIRPPALHLRVIRGEWLQDRGQIVG
jgi:hypothetical protein